jgi:hypothetical protein
MDSHGLNNGYGRKTAIAVVGDRALDGPVLSPSSAGRSFEREGAGVGKAVSLDQPGDLAAVPFPQHDGIEN